MSRKTAVVWFRNDLRLHDNEALIHALQIADNVVPVYVFDPRVMEGKTRFGFRKTGVFRANFILESVRDLRNSLRELGSDLIVRYGYPEEEVFKLAGEVQSSWVFCNRERTAEEVTVQDALEQNLWTIGQEIFYARGKMLYYTQDLPFPITQTPDIFTQFRKEVEKVVQVRKPLDTPGDIACEPGLLPEPGDIPGLLDLGFSEEELPDDFVFEGGETAGLERLHYYLWETDLVQQYKETRNGLLGMDYSSKFSPYLAQGCLSPKKIYWEIKRYESERVANQSTYWMIFELMWRDYFRLVAKKYKERIFLKGGPKEKVFHSLSEDFQAFDKWAEGFSGIPFVDANMRELNRTGFMSNRGRQNVASYLVKDLKLNWQMGAEYFESLLIDYDPCSNWGNWNYVAGVGMDPRSDRYFNVIGQGKRYDPDAEFIKHWLPELSKLDSDVIHDPYKWEGNELYKAGIFLGRDYPEPYIEKITECR